MSDEAAASYVARINQVGGRDSARSRRNNEWHLT